MELTEGTFELRGRGVRWWRQDCAFVELDGAAGDREAQADAAADAVTVGFDAIEGVEEAGESIVGDAGALVADSYGDCGVMAPSR